MLRSINLKKNAFTIISVSLLALFLIAYFTGRSNQLEPEVIQPHNLKFKAGGFDKQPVVTFKLYPADEVNGTDLVDWLKKNKRLKEKNLHLPSCPKDLKMNGDDIAVEKLTNCAKKDTLLFPVTMESWRYTKKTVCGNQFLVFHREAGLLQNVVIDSRLVKGQCSVDDIDRDFTLPKETFSLVKSKDCIELNKDYFFRGGTHHSQWLESAVVKPLSISPKPSSFFTIAVRRYEHHNIYHTMSDIYNAFRAARFLGISPKSVDILFIDGKASEKAPLLHLWRRLFNHVDLICSLEEPVLYPALFWNQLGLDSDFLAYSNDELPLVEDFSHFVLSSFKLQPKQLDCLRPLTALMISRGNYMNRTIERQISNEREILHAINNEKSVGVIAQWVRLETLDIAAQLRLASTCDIIVGMHGAGLTLSMFIPSHAGIVEMKPKYFQKAHWHFEGIANWRHLHYDRWENEMDKIESQGTHTEVPVQILSDMLYKMRRNICGN